VITCELDSVVGGVLRVPFMRVGVGFPGSCCLQCCHAVLTFFDMVVGGVPSLAHLVGGS